MTDTLRFSVHGMTCDGCVRSVRAVLGALPGTTVEHVGLDTPAVVRVEDAQTDRQAIRHAVEAAGYTVDFDSV